MDASVRGNLGKDPELRTLASGTVVGRFSVAASQSQSEREKDAEAVWVDVQVFGDLATRCAEALKQGDPVVVLGYWRADKWTTKDGESRYRTYITATAVGPDLSRATVTGVTRPSKSAPAAVAGPPSDPYDED